MKIVLITTSTTGGGAAHAALRLFEALLTLGADVRMIALHGHRCHERIDVLDRGLWARLRSRYYHLRERLEIASSLYPHIHNLWRLSSGAHGFDLSQHPWVQEADIIHLHWISHGLLSIQGLEALATLGKPIVWTLHDLWSATGGCHLPLSFEQSRALLCTRYTHSCGQCPLLGRQASTHDWTSEVRARKAFLYRPPFHYIAVSSRAGGIFSMAEDSAHISPMVIPPPLELSQYHTAIRPDPLPTWYLPQRIYLMVSAARLDDAVKGPHLLVETMQALHKLAPDGLRQRLALVLVGQIKQANALEGIPLDQVRLGGVSSQQMRELYQLADVVLSTSLFETFGQTLTEALASGVPVVSFASGGPEDIIRPGHNGYLAPAYDTEALARCILRVVDDRAEGRLSAEQCRASVVHISSLHVGEQHQQYYMQILNSSR